MKKPAFLVVAMAAMIFVSCEKKEDEKPASEPAEQSASIPFDKMAWLATDGTDYPNREKMVQDLFRDDKLKGLTREQIVEKLGEPTRTDKNYLFYRISQMRVGFLPVKTKTLVIRLSPQGLSEAVLIHGG